jgi:hypothetical protein
MEIKDLTDNKKIIQAITFFGLLIGFMKYIDKYENKFFKESDDVKE